MKYKILFSIILLLLVLIIPSVTKAAPSNNPVFATIEFVQQAISDAINPLQEAIDELIVSLGLLQGQVNNQAEEISDIQDILSATPEPTPTPTPTPTSEPGFVPDKIIDVCFHVDTAALTVMKGGTCFPHVHWKIAVQCVDGKPCQPDNPDDPFYDPPI